LGVTQAALIVEESCAFFDADNFVMIRRHKLANSNNLGAGSHNAIVA